MIVFDQIFGLKSSSKVVYKFMLTELVSTEQVRVVR